jgi:hypothetical protein
VVVGGVIQAAYPGPETMLKPARYSAGGPTDTPPCDGEPARTGPDVVAVSDISAVRHGVLVTGTLGGSAARLSGTSIAAPQVTYTLARLAETGKAPDRATIQASAESGGVNGPVERTGAGLVSYPLNQR